MQTKRRRASLLLSCLAGGALTVFDCAALQITDGPNYTLVSPTAAQIQWTTDLPSDSTVNYGVDFSYSQMVHDPTPVTYHVISLPALAAGAVYDYAAISATGSASDTTYGELVLPDQLAYFQLPSSNAIVSGMVQLKAVPGDASILVEQVGFFYVNPTNGQLVLIGFDQNGTDKTFDSQFQPTPTGDGWSAYWDTTALPETNYTIIAVLSSSLGPLTAASAVYVDQTPPKPTFVTPQFGDTVSGLVLLNGAGAGAGGGGGGGGRGKGKAVVEVQPNGSTNITFGPVSLTQTNYPYDHNHGLYMCDPTSQAAVFLSDPTVVDFLKKNTPCKTNANPDQCIRDYLVKLLAGWKKTSSTGTLYGNEDSGTAEAIKFLKLAGTNKWISGLFAENAATYSVPALKQALKAALDAKPGTVPKGMIIHIAPCNNPSATGHCLAVAKINDTPKKNSTGGTVYDVDCMDPATGETITLTVDGNGQTIYPPGSGQCKTVTGGRVWLGPAPPAPKDDSWQIVGVDTNGNGNWNVYWDTRDFAPGLYWVRMTVTDDVGNIGQDVLEVFVAPRLSISVSGPNVLLSWPVAPPNNFALQASDALGAASHWTVVTNVVTISNGKYMITNSPSGPTRFYRLIQQ